MFGAGGQIGNQLFRNLCDITGSKLGVQTMDVELASRSQIIKALRSVASQQQVDVIINAAAYTDVDEAESEPDRAHAVNAVAPGIIAEEAEALGALFVHYSSDYVFSGVGSRAWREDDPIDPINVYGGTKVLGEDSIRAATRRHLIFRTAWVYSARRKNFLRTMLRLARERDSFQVIDDQHGTPTDAAFIANATTHAIQSTLANDDHSGTYHITAAGSVTWHGYATFIIEQARQMGFPIKVHSNAIHPVTTADFPTKAKRPHNSRLNCKRFDETFGWQRAHWQEGVVRVLNEIAESKGFK